MSKRPAKTGLAALLAPRLAEIRKLGKRIKKNEANRKEEHMEKLRYVIEIEDTGDCRLLAAKVTLPNGRETAQVFEPRFLLPMLNTITATLADDIESRL